jgi:hypothetical protein
MAAPGISRGDSISRVQHSPERDSAGDIRSILLVVAALVAAATFQAAINPPGGVWQDTSVVDGKTHYAGKAIMASKPNAYRIFIFCNSMAFSSSTLIIAYLVFRIPFYLETYMALIALTATYCVSVATVVPPDTNSDAYLIALCLPYVVSCTPRLFNWLRDKKPSC